MGDAVRGHTAGMPSDFSGETAAMYARYRRDLPVEQAVRLAELAGLRPDDVLIDLGCGTGQLAVPMSEHCAAVVGVDPEPAMLAGLRARGVDRVVCVLDDNDGLARLGAMLGRPVGSVTIGNALHWMDEAATLHAAAALLRPGGAVCVVTQGPPMWLGAAPWQLATRQVLERRFGPPTGTCRTDPAALAERADIARGLGLAVQVATLTADHSVDTDWVLGHLGSAMDPEQLTAARDDLAAALTATGVGMVEHVVTTALVARRP